MNGLGRISIDAVPGLPEVTAGFNLGAAISDGIDLRDDDIVVVSQKVVSKAEGRTVVLGEIEPGDRARDLAAQLGKDPRLVEVILAESREVVRTDPERSILITETHHGFVCANAGVDASNLPESGTVVLLPKDCDRSAKRIRGEVEAENGIRPAVVVSDSFGRAWRLGQSEVAVGCAGLEPLDDWRGLPDRSGNILAATTIAIADEMAAAADLARNKTSGTPAVRLRGLGRFVQVDDGPGCRGQVRPPAEDLFR